MKGSYTLIIELKKSQKTKIGAIGIINFNRGYYAYVGSAMNNLDKRIERHLRSRKKIKWHIDYFLRRGKIVKVIKKESKKREECRIAKKLSKKFPDIPKFGSSDCCCKSHLFYLGRQWEKGNLKFTRH